MWRYQTQQDHAAINVGVESSHWTSSAWISANEAFERVASEPTTVRPQSPGGWTQPCHHRWQGSGLMSSCQSTGLSSRCYSTSARASCPRQSAQAGCTQHPQLDNWAACHRHIPPQSQQPTQFDRELTAAISFAVAPGRIPIVWLSTFFPVTCCRILMLLRTFTPMLHCRPQFHFWQP